jgi:uncharacterized membrane protein YobD (UPF0266 family)
MIYITIAIVIVSVVMVPKEDMIIALAIALLVTAFLLWIFWGTYYEFREEYLYCKSGPFFEKIPYAKIQSAKLCQNMLSSMALSSKRIEIRQHGKGYILGTTMISPINREEFLHELLKRCKYLES